MEEVQVAKERGKGGTRVEAGKDGRKEVKEKRKRGKG